MRVLLTSDTIGGVWTFTHELTNGLLVLGHQVALISFGAMPSPAQSSAMRALENAFYGNFQYIPTSIPLEWMQDNERASSEGCRAIEQILEDFKPQLLHSSQFCFGSLRTEIPVLITAHSDVLSWAESTLTGIAELEQTTSPDWLNRYRNLVTRGLRQATAIAAPTHWMAAQIARLYELRSSPTVIANGISPAQPAAAARKLQAVTAGRLWDQAKGLTILSEIAPPFPILVAGEQRSTPPPACTNLLGSLPHQKLLDLFAESAIYLATSLYEPFGLAPLEAAQAGCAIVARDIPTFREVWGDAALYFQSAITLQRLLNSLATNPRRLRAAQCRAHHRSFRYADQSMTENYLALYEKLLRPSPIAKEQVLAHA